MSSGASEGMVDVEGVRNQLKEMEDYLQRSKDRQHKLRNWNKFLTLTILFVFAAYIFLFYFAIRDNFAAEKFNKSIRVHTTDLVPKITDAALAVVSEIQPDILAMVDKKAETFIPVFMVELEKEADLFIADMSKFGEKEFRTRLERIVNQVAEEFKKQYPDLTDQQLERFVNETETDLRVMFLELSEHIVNQSLPEIMEMKNLSEDLAEGHPKMEEDALYRLFLHNLLLLLDKEIMEG